MSFCWRASADDLVDRLSAINRRFPMALNLGAHHGLLGRKLRQLPGIETVIDLEQIAASLGAVQRIARAGGRGSAPLS